MVKAVDEEGRTEVAADFGEHVDVVGGVAVVRGGEVKESDERPLAVRLDQRVNSLEEKQNKILRHFFRCFVKHKYGCCTVAKVQQKSSKIIQHSGELYGN